MWASCGLAGVIAALVSNLIRTVIRSQGTRNVHTVREKVRKASLTKNPNGACPGPCWLVPDRPGTNLAADQMLRLRT